MVLFYLLKLYGRRLTRDLSIRISKEPYASCITGAAEHYKITGIDDARKPNLFFKRFKIYTFQI